MTGDIVTFNSAMTVNLNSQLVITKNLTVDGDLNNDGVADVTLSGQYKTQVLKGLPRPSTAWSSPRVSRQARAETLAPTALRPWAAVLSTPAT